MVFDAGGPLIFNCRYTSFITVVHHPQNGTVDRSDRTEGN